MTLKRIVFLQLANGEFTMQRINKGWVLFGYAIRANNFKLLKKNTSV